MITGLKKLEHVELTVPDIEQALEFFSKHFGAKVIGEANNFSSEDDWMKEHLNVHPRAVIEKGKMIKLFDGSILELFQYQSPDQNTNYPKNSDVGGHHLAFDVEDIEKAMGYLRENGIKILGDYTYNDPSWPNISGVFENIKWVYFQTSWGLSIELIEAK